VVSYSGGKDFTCCLEITIEVARELGKLPVGVLLWAKRILNLTKWKAWRRRLLIFVIVC